MCCRNLMLMLLVCAIGASIVGCSEPITQFPVSGTVIIDGKPLSTGSIQFVPTDGRPIGGKINSDGSFRLVNSTVGSGNTKPGVPKGTYRIAVSSSVIVDEDNGKVHFNIPKHYADFRTSDLDVEITGPKKDMVIELTWEGFEDAADAESTEEVADETSNEPSVESAEGSTPDQKVPARETGASPEE